MIERIAWLRHGSPPRDAVEAALRAAWAGGGGGETVKTVTGSIVSIADAKAAAARSILVSIVPSQTGTPSPDNVIPITGLTGADVWDDPVYGGLVVWNQRCGTGGSSSTGGGVTYTNNGDGTWTLTNNGTATNRKQIGSPSIAANHIIYMRHGADIDGSSSTFGVSISNSGGSLQSTYNRDGGLFRVGSNGMNQFSIRTFSSFVPPEGGLVLCPQLFDLTTMFGEAKAEAIYAMENGRDYFLDLFPKHYYAYNNDGNLKTVSEVNVDPYRHAAFDFGGTIYGGTLNVTTGKLTVTHASIASYAGEAINEPWLSSMDVYTAGGTPTTGAQVVYPLTTPTEVTLTPTEVVLFLGANNVWSNGGNTTLSYVAGD